MTESAVDAALERLAQLHPRSIDLSLGRIERLLDALGRPQDRLAPVIHVAGTNGKGSTIAFLRAMIEADAKRVHVYSSPHLVRFNERIVIGGEEISDTALVELLQRVEDVNAGETITFFEITTAAAMLAFSEAEADFTLLEVGLGGRFDATNVVAEPACSVITPVGLDHKEYLGDDIVHVALEKAGILKAGVPAIIGPQEPAARAAIAAEGLACGVGLKLWGRDFRACMDNGRLAYEDESRLLDLPLPSLIGAHQIANAGCAVATALEVGAASPDAIARGVESAVWPGRLQRLTSGVLADAAAAFGGELWIDGAHNAMGARALARTLADLGDADPRPLVLIVAMQRTKDPLEFLTAFQGLARAVVGVALTATENTWSGEEMRQAAAGLGFSAEAADALAPAINKAAEWSADTAKGRGPRVVACGSLYLAGEALAVGTGASPRATAG